jgi:hypothetical protein
MIGPLLSMTNPGWLTPGIGVAGLLHDGIPAQAQFIDQRTFNALHNVPGPSEANGYAVCMGFPDSSHCWFSEVDGALLAIFSSRSN